MENTAANNGQRETLRDSETLSQRPITYTLSREQKLKKAVEYLLEGHTLPDVLEAIGEPQTSDLPDELTEYFIEKSKAPRAATAGWCMEALRDMYRRSVAVGDYPAAMRAVDQLHKMGLS